MIEPPATPPTLASTAPAADGDAGYDPRRSVNRLTHYDLSRFPSENLHDRLGRAVCAAHCLPRKEFYEAWEVARRVARRVRGRPVYDLASGHGLVASMLLMLDAKAPRAVCVDRRIPPSAHKVQSALVAVWPQLAGRVTHEERLVQTLDIEPGALVVGVHACGALTDLVLDVALAAGAAVALVPCCHSHAKCDAAGLDAWIDPDLAIDLTRVARLRAAGYTVHLSHIPAGITPENRLIIAEPPTS